MRSLYASKYSATRSLNSSLSCYLVISHFVSLSLAYIGHLQSQKINNSITNDPMTHSGGRLSSRAIAHSERRLFTGLATAAFTDWKLTVAKAINMAPPPAITNTHHCTS